MKALKTIEIRKIEPAQLPSSLQFRLNFRYETELKNFVAMYEHQDQVLYVNKSVPKVDAKAFLDICSYTGTYISNPDCPVSDTIDYVFKTYGSSTYFILMDAWGKRRQVIEAVKSDQRARKVIPEIEKMIQETIKGDIPDIFDEALVYRVSSAGMDTGLKTAENLVGYGTKYVFYLGYLMGSARIRVNAKSNKKKKK